MMAAVIRQIMENSILTRQTTRHGQVEHPFGIFFSNQMITK